jgi:exonuclease SbcC
VTRRQSLDAAVERARASLTTPLRDGEVEQLATAVDRARRAAQERDRLLGRLERRSTATAERQTAVAERDAAEVRRQELLAEVAALGFDAVALDAARTTAATAAVASEQALKAAREAELGAASAKVAAEQAAARLADAESQHAKLETVREDARHLSRVAELLGSFRNTLVGAVGPRLEAHASAHFDELTDHAYEGIVLDPETYEIRIRDAGVIHGTERFSGSEVDLANLALRVAISEHVRFVSGGQVGLLVLDEIFGSLDDDRRARLLGVLERLRGRFRQILVITHSTDIKEQLPQALEVVTVGERRATVRSLV